MKQLIAVPNFCIQVLSKSLAYLMLDTVELDQDSRWVLDDAEAKMILSAVEKWNVKLPDFVSPFTPEYALLLLKSFSVYSPNQVVLLTQQSLFPSLQSLLLNYQTDIAIKNVIYQILLQLINAPVFEETLSQCLSPFTEAIQNSIPSDNVLLKNVAMLVLHHLQHSEIELLIKSHFEETATALSKPLNEDGSSISQPNSCTCNLIEVSCSFLTFSSKGFATLKDSNIIPALFKAITSIFTGTYVCIQMHLPQLCSRLPKVIVQPLIEHLIWSPPPAEMSPPPPPKQLQF